MQIKEINQQIIFPNTFDVPNKNYLQPVIE